MAMRRVRDHLSANRPNGRPTRAYINVATVASNPSAVSLRRNSLRIGSAKAPGNWRSKKFSRLMANRTKSANEALDARFALFAISKFGSHRDPESSRISQERVDLVVLNWRIEGDLVVALVGDVGAPD